MPDINDTQPIEISPRQHVAGIQPSAWRVLGPQLVIAVIFSIIFGVCVAIVFTQTLQWDEVQKSIALYLLGILSAVLMQVVGFFYNSSAGSKMKDTKPPAATGPH